ncbi:DEAD/DEAH box helicase [Sphingobacterium psychroaquaticum]|uniref:ATP-dependent RNA helicase RhlE n=1 Tax=Sphingobacterium psychroaquaticum TaxID=561061 RepID=A0A1X7HZT4_9SPHI|nr:DEAD/DEAH box helicase [Sphingobacterium psychroaquaticum]SMG07121.1 ATP-dependent RNA helicase RhlE [Sphingobacterium psychroaquaticum]
MKFEELITNKSLVETLTELGYVKATAIQQKLIPTMLSGTDILAVAPTGSGKTEAFAIPIISAYIEATAENRKQTLILSPTRELAIQTADRIQKLGKKHHVGCISIYGGATYEKQAKALAQNPAVIVATPGRLLDLYNQGIITFENIQKLILDEVDQMLELGFLHDVNTIIAPIPTSAQRVFVSATLPEAIEKMAKKQLRDMTYIQISETQKKITEYLLFVDKADKKDLILFLQTHFGIEQAIVFTRTTHGVDRIVKHLTANGLPTEGLYGDKTQATRESIVQDFRDKKFSILVATDVATRGIDIPNLSAVINYELPETAANYQHRIGRTGRTQEGIAFTFCDGEDNLKLISLQTELKKTIPIFDKHPYPLSWQKMQTSSPVVKKGKKQGKRKK